MTKQSLPSFLDPSALQRVAGLELRARLVVEGFVTGMHKSPYLGSSVEFAEHREYCPGDEIKHIDWKVFGKSDRYHVKRFEEETNLRSYLLLDSSASMAYGSNSMNKMGYATCIAASLGLLLLRQRDSVGLLTFDADVRKYIPPRSTPHHFRLMLGEMENLRPQAQTNVAKVCHDFAERIRRRGLIVILSDLFDDPRNILVSLRHFRHRKHEVIVFQILDPAEITFPFEDATVFRGLETGRRIRTDPRAIRKHYLEAFENHRETLKQGCHEQRIDFVPLTTDEPFDRALSRYLAFREART